MIRTRTDRYPRRTLSRVESYEELIERSQPAADDRPDEEYRDRLRALGYVE